MVYLIIDKTCENNIKKTAEYRKKLENLYNDKVECIIQDNRVITPLGEVGKALEERGRKIREELKKARAVYLFRECEFTELK